MILSMSQTPQTPERALRPVVGLAQLAEAFACAADGQCDKWEFAIRMENLPALGIGESELRWLVSKGYAEHACETTTTRNTTRKFRPGRNLAFTAKTCFVLTDAGATYAATVLGESGTGPFFGGSPSAGPQVTHRPHWDGELRVLRMGTDKMKEYRLPAPNQEAILAAFEEEGWPDRIDDPLSLQADLDPKCRLHDTIKRLNQAYKHSPLRFYGDGTGEGVCWKLVAEAAQNARGQAAPKRPRLAA